MISIFWCLVAREFVNFKMRAISRRYALIDTIIVQTLNKISIMDLELDLINTILNEQLF